MEYADENMPISISPWPGGKGYPLRQRWAGGPPDEDTDGDSGVPERDHKSRPEQKPSMRVTTQGVFTGFVLLSKGEWDKDQFIRDMEKNGTSPWRIRRSEGRRRAGV